MKFTALPETPPVAHDFFELKREWVEVPGAGKVSYVRAGSGPPLLLVHGLLTSAYSWRYVISSLAQRYTVVAVDLPGAGQSDAAPELSASPQSLGEVLEAFVARLGWDKVYVVGNSMGGYVCLWWMLAHPERFERLVVIHSPGFPELRLYALHALLWFGGVSRALLGALTRNHEQFALDNCHYHRPELISREQTREFGRQLAEPSRRECFRRNLYETMDPWTMRGLPGAVASRSALPRVLLLWAREDALVSPAFGPRYQAMLPGSELVWLERSSHFTQVDAPERTVEEILRFGTA